MGPGYRWAGGILALFFLLIGLFGFEQGCASFKENPQGETQPTGGDAQISIPILMYHHLAPEGSSWQGNPMVVTSQAFSLQMKALRSGGYQTISLAQLRDFYLEGKPLPPKPILITFDDGYESNYMYAYPVLKQLGMKAAIFIVVKNSPQETVQGYDPNGRTHLSWPELAEMANSGLIEIQSHTYDSHKLIPTGPDGQQGPPLISKKYDSMAPTPIESEEAYRQRIAGDLSLAKKEIEDHLGQGCFALAYPYGAYNSEVEDIAKTTGYSLIFLTSGSPNGPKENPLRLQRIAVLGSDTVDQLMAKLNP